MSRKPISINKPSKEELIHLYINRGLYMREIGEMYNTCRQKVDEWFKEYGLVGDRSRCGTKHWETPQQKINDKSIKHKLYTKFGAIKKCELCGTVSSKNYTWVNLTGKTLDIYDYMRMCTSCGTKYKKRYNKGVELETK